MSSWKVLHSPLRRSESACSWIRVGQFVGEALSAWRRVSWILGGLVSNELSQCVEQTIGAIGIGIGGPAA